MHPFNAIQKKLTNPTSCPPDRSSAEDRLSQLEPSSSSSLQLCAHACYKFTQQDCQDLPQYFHSPGHWVPPHQQVPTCVYTLL